MTCRSPAVSFEDIGASSLTCSIQEADRPQGFDLNQFLSVNCLMLQRTRRAAAKSGARRASLPRAWLRIPALAQGTTVNQLAHRRNGYRPERCTRDIINFAKDTAQRLLLARRIADCSTLLRGAQVFEQLDQIQERRPPRVTDKLIPAAYATDRANETGPAHDVHNLRQVMIGDAVFCTNLGDGKLLALARGQFQNREYGKPG